MHSQPPFDTRGLEPRVRELGRAILREARRVKAEQSPGDRWIGSVLERSTANERFRAQALRFVDIMPVLTDDGELVRHLKEYFTDEELPLPGIARWGLSRMGAGPGTALLAKAVRKAMTTMAQRFLGGADVAQVLDTISRLKAQGFSCSLDRLGEAVVSEAEADTYLQAYRELMDRLGSQPIGTETPTSVAGS